MSRILVLCLMLLVTGCGTMTRLAYNHADIAARMAIDDHFALDDDQAGELRPRLLGFHTWHRRAELPRYAALANDVGSRIERGLLASDVGWALAQVRDRYRILTARGIDDAVPVLARLNDANVAALEKKLAQGNDKIRREQMMIDETRGRADQLKTMRKRVEDWIGDLTPAQTQIVSAYVTSLPGYSKDRFDDRQRRQRDFVAVLREHRDATDLPTRLKLLAVNFDDRRGAEYTERMRRFDQSLTTLLVDLDRSLLPAQRQRAVQRLRGFAQDFQQLAGSGASVSTGATVRTVVAESGSVEPAFNAPASKLVTPP